MAENKTKKGDFIKISYTGYTDDGIVFDTLDRKIAEKNNLYDEHRKYEPMIIRIGDNNVLKGLDDKLSGLEVNKEYSFVLKAEEAFGKKTSKLIKLVPLKKFKENNINPISRLELNIDGSLATVRSVSGGRVILDFNHPLAGKDIRYDIKISEIILDPLTKAKEFVKLNLGIEISDMKLDNDKLTVTLPFKLAGKFNLKIVDDLKKRMLEAIPEIKKIEFKEPKENAKDKKPDEELKNNVTKN